MKLLRIAALTVAVLGSATVASANTIWNFSNVSFLSPGTPTGPGVGTSIVTGFFEVDSPLGGPSALTNWDFTVTGTNTTAAHHYVFGGFGEGGLFGSPSILYFYNFGPNVVIQVYLASAMTNAGGTINLTNSSIVCPGCGTLVSGSITTASVNQPAAVPEPATLVLCGLGAMFAVSRLRRRQ
jgi:hypothetical protein